MIKTIAASTMRRMTMEMVERPQDKDEEKRKKVISDINEHIYVAAMDGEFKVYIDNKEYIALSSESRTKIDNHFRKCGYTCYRNLDRTVTIMW